MSIKKHIGFSTKDPSKRKVYLLQQYLDDDYDSTIVIDADSIPIHYKTQLENMVESINAQQTKRLIDFIQYETFNDGTNILQYAHQNGHIKKLKASELEISIDGTKHNVQPYTQILPYILENDGKVRPEDKPAQDEPTEEPKAEDTDTTKEVVEEVTKTEPEKSVPPVKGDLVQRYEDAETVTFVMDKSSVESVEELGKAYNELKVKTMEYLDHLRQQQVDVYNIVKGGDTEILEAIAGILGVEPMPLRKSLSNLRNIPMKDDDVKKKRGRPKADKV